LEPEKCTAKPPKFFTKIINIQRLNQHARNSFFWRLQHSESGAE
jgi:hypothetical protein